MLNHITIMGRLTRDPELRRTGSGIAVASFTLAVYRDFPNKETGEFVSKYFTKGRMAVVSGRLQIRKWQNDQGENRYSTEVVADNVYFGHSKREGNTGNTPTPAPSYTPPVTPDASDFALLDDDDAQLPF